MSERICFVVANREETEAKLATPEGATAAPGWLVWLNRRQADEFIRLNRPAGAAVYGTQIDWDRDTKRSDYGPVNVLRFYAPVVRLDDEDK